MQEAALEKIAAKTAARQQTKQADPIEKNASIKPVETATAVAVEKHIEPRQESSLKIVKEVEAQPESNQADPGFKEVKESTEPKKETPSTKPDKQDKPETKEDKKKYETLTQDQKDYITQVTGKKTEQPEGAEAKPTTTDTAKPEQKETKPQESKAPAADPLDSDPLVTALKTYLKNGGSDLNEFAQEVGAVGDVSKLSVKDLYTIQAKELGSDDVENDVQEMLDKLDEMPNLERKQVEKKLREEYAGRNKEKLSTYISQKNESSVQEQSRVKSVYDNATATLTQEVQSITNKKVGALFIDEKMAEAIYQLAPYESPQEIKDGKLVKIDVQKGVKKAIRELYGDLIDAAHIELGRAIEFEESLNENHRPNENRQASQGAVSRTPQKGSRDAAKELAAERNPSRWGARRTA